MNKELKYEFRLEIQKVYLKIPFECSVNIWWRRGRGKTTTKNSVKLKGNESYFKVAQALAIQGKCSLRNGVFEKKQSTIQIVIFNKDNTTKLGGACSVDLVTILSPTNISMNHSQNFELPLQNTPDKQARIQFALSVKYLGECSEDSAHDISFQGNLNQTSDMTFRPGSQERKNSHRKSERVSGSQNFMNKIPESPLQLQEKDKKSRQSESQSPHSNDYSHRHEPKSVNNGEKPMEFSFNPKVDPEREKQNKYHLQMISELRHQVAEKNKEGERLKDRIHRLELEQRQNQSHSNEKNLSLMNELNVANSKIDDLKRQLKNAEKVQKNLKEVQKTEESLQREKQNLHQTLSNKENEIGHLNSKVQNLERSLEEKRRGEGDIAKRLHELQKQNSSLKEENFRKQSEYISLENKYEKEAHSVKLKLNELSMVSEQLASIKSQQETLHQENQHQKKTIKEQAQQIERLHSTRRQIEQDAQGSNSKLQQVEFELKNAQMISHELQEKNSTLKQTLEHYSNQIDNLKDSINQLNNNARGQKQSSDRNYQLLQQRFREKQQLLTEIEEEFGHIQSDNRNQSQEKQYQIASLRQKLADSTERVQSLLKNEESSSILISEMKVRMKNLESACDNLEKELDERDEIIEQKQSLIEKAKNYVKQKQKELEERDEFIANAKTFVKEREEEFESEKRKFNEYLENANNNNSVSNREVQSLRQKVAALSSELISGRQQASLDKQRLMNENMAKASLLEENIREKERELQNLRNRLNQKDQQFWGVKTQGSNQERAIRQLKGELNSKSQRIEDLEHFIESLQQRIEITQEQLEEINRKNQGLNETLEEIVRKNFDLDIQLNVKTAQLEAVRSYSNNQNMIR